MQTLTITDENFGGTVISEIKIQIDKENVTVKDIIEARVIAEVEKHNQKASEYFHGLVQPTDTEQTLNGFRMKNTRKIDAEKQVYIALEAFQKNGYFVLIDDEQASSLEQTVQINPKTKISFMKLTPLVGG